MARAISSNIDDRVLHELYAWPFAETIKAGVSAVMTSYNEVNGSAASQNSMLINGILKDELGFQGFVSHFSRVASSRVLSPSSDYVARGQLSRRNLHSLERINGSPFILS